MFSYVLDQLGLKLQKTDLSTPLIIKESPFSSTGCGLCVEVWVGVEV